MEARLHCRHRLSRPELRSGDMKIVKGMKAAMWRRFQRRFAQQR
jgi:hypothetical protein